MARSPRPISAGLAERSCCDTVRMSTMRMSTTTITIVATPRIAKPTLLPVNRTQNSPCSGDRPKSSRVATATLELSVKNGWGNVNQTLRRSGVRAPCRMTSFSLLLLSQPWLACPLSSSELPSMLDWAISGGLVVATIALAVDGVLNNTDTGRDLIAKIKARRLTFWRSNRK